MKRFPWHIRPLIGEGDRKYVVQTWRASLRSTREHGADAKPTAQFRRDVDEPIDAILDRRDTRVLIAAPSAEDRQTIAGWIAWTPVVGGAVLHYVYVRGAKVGNARGTGAARLLAQHAQLSTVGRLMYTFRGPDADRLLVRFPDTTHVSPSAFLGREER